MSNIEKIRQEIERQRSFIEGLFIEGDNNFYDGQDDAYNHLLAFIDSLPEEKPSEECIKEEADNYLYGDDVKPYYYDTDCGKNLYTSDDIWYAFKAGAEWAVDYMEERE